MAKLDQLPTEILDYILASLSSSDSPTRQNDLASLVLTNKRFCLLATRSLYDRPVLRNAKRVSQYLRTHLGWINPWSRLNGEKREIVKPTSISFDYRSPGGGKLCKVPSLSFFLKLGYFDNLTSLHLHNFHDTEHLIPRLLAPHSPLRSQLRELSMAPDRIRVIDDLTLSFLLEPAIYCDIDMFTEFRIIPSTECIDLDHTWIYCRTPDPDLDPVYPEEEERASTESKVQAHTDFDAFCSKFDYGFCDGWQFRVPHSDTWDIDPTKTLVTPSPFSSLTSLSISIGTNFNLVVLLGGPTFAQLKTLVLSSSNKIRIEVEDDDITLIRRSFTHGPKLDRPLRANCIGPNRMDLGRRAYVSSLNWFVRTEWARGAAVYGEPRGGRMWPRLDHNGWNYESLGKYRGPKLEVLDLRELYLKLI